MGYWEFSWLVSLVLFPSLQTVNFYMISFCLPIARPTRRTWRTSSSSSSSESSMRQLCSARAIESSRAYSQFCGHFVGGVAIPRFLSGPLELGQLPALMADHAAHDHGRARENERPGGDQREGEADHRRGCQGDNHSADYEKRGVAADKAGLFGPRGEVVVSDAEQQQ